MPFINCFQFSYLLYPYARIVFPCPLKLRYDHVTWSGLEKREPKNHLSFQEEALKPQEQVPAAGLITNVQLSMKSLLYFVPEWLWWTAPIRAFTGHLPLTRSNFCCIKLLWRWFIISAQHRPPRMGHPRGLWSSRPRLSCSSKGCSFMLLTCSNYSALWLAFPPQMRSRLTRTQLLPDLCSNCTFYVRLTLNTPPPADAARQHSQTLQTLLYIMRTYCICFKLLGLMSILCSLW